MSRSGSGGNGDDDGVAGNGGREGRRRTFSKFHNFSPIRKFRKQSVNSF